jgi:hypothetical protein
VPNTSDSHCAGSWPAHIIRNKLLILAKRYPPLPRLETMIKKELLKAKKSKCFISVWLYSDQDSFWCGKVQGIKDGILSLEHYTKYALKDGIVYFDLSDIESFDFSDIYSTAMAQLEKNSNALHKIEKVKYPVASGKNWKTRLLKFAIENTGTPLTIEFRSDIQICGILKSLDTEYFCIETYGKLGEHDGKSIYRIEDIGLIQFNDIETRKRLLLAKLLKT